jgi:hypothetical protein
MFIGHFALGFAAKRATPRLSLAVLFAAAQHGLAIGSDDGGSLA